MIEILAHGSQDRFHATCSTCRCIFTFNEKDVVHVSDIKLVKCPECGHKILYRDIDEKYTTPLLPVFGSSKKETNK